MKSMNRGGAGQRYPRLCCLGGWLRPHERAKPKWNDILRRTTDALIAAIASLAAAPAEFVRSYAEGFAMARLCGDLWRLEHAELAELGVDRNDIGRHVLETMDRQETDAPSTTGHSIRDPGRGDPLPPVDDPRLRCHAA